MDEVARFNRLVSLIYEAALEPAAWGEALSALAQAFGADAWHFLGWDTAQGTDVLGLMPLAPLATKALTDYNAHYGAIDPRRALSAQFGPSIVLRCDRHFDERFVSGNEFFQDYLLPMGFRYSMGGCLRQSGNLNYQLGLQRSPDRGPFMEKEEQRLQDLMPHFNRALLVMERGETLKQATDIAGAGFSTTPLAIIAVDSRGRIRHSNPRGEQLLRAEDLVRQIGGLLVCVDQEQQHRFAEALSTCAMSNQTTGLLVKHKRLRNERYSVTFTRTPDRDGFGQLQAAASVLCLIAPVDRRRIATVRQLMTLFGLSAGEGRLARAIANGESPDDYARDAGLKITTVRSQLAGIFAKTGTNRQVDLVRLITSIPVVRD